MATCVPWDVDLGCIPQTDWSAYPKDVQDRAIELAWNTLVHLTGGMVGACPVAVRPCRKGCTEQRNGLFFGSGGQIVPPFQPMLRGGYWYNVQCGCSGPECHCGPELCEIKFPGYVAQVLNVWVDGALVDPVAYRLDNGRNLVRQDGDCWPRCQDLTVPWDAQGAFTIEYIPGVKPNGAGLAAAGVLAVEYAKACSGQKCRLPSSVSSISRQGVSMEFSQGMFPDGHTGIREVDAYVLTINPNHLVKPPLVWSPDVIPMRFTDIKPPQVPPAGPFGFEFALDFAVLQP